MNIAQPKDRSEINHLVDQYVAKGGTITVPEPKQPKRAPRINSGDEKFDLYCSALPSIMRQWAKDTSQDVRALYKEYRALGRDGLVAKYQDALDGFCNVE